MGEGGKEGRSEGAKERRGEGEAGRQRQRQRKRERHCHTDTLIETDTQTHRHIDRRQRSDCNGDTLIPLTAACLHLCARVSERQHGSQPRAFGCRCGGLQ